MTQHKFFPFLALMTRAILSMVVAAIAIVSLFLVGYVFFGPKPNLETEIYSPREIFESKVINLCRDWRTFSISPSEREIIKVETQNLVDNYVGSPEVSIDVLYCLNSMEVTHNLQDV